MHATLEQARILREAVDAVRSDPASFDMSNWTNQCGTVCCLAGQIVRNHSTREEWSTWVQRERTEADRDTWEDRDFPIREEAERLLGIDAVQTERLFFHDDWPRCFLTVLNCGVELPTPEVLAARIERWIENGE